MKVVLDTNVLLSSLLFRGHLSTLVDLWKTGAFVIVFSEETFAEFRRALEYPKFSLTAEERDSILIDEILPFIEVVEITEPVIGVCRDASDDAFLSCAVAAGADMIVSGDSDLLQLKQYRSIPIINPVEFIERLK